MITYDLTQLADGLPNKAKFKAPKGEHNALIDAEWNEAFYDYLTTTDNKLQPK